MKSRSSSTATAFVTTTEESRPSESGFGRGTDATRKPVLALSTWTPPVPAAMNAFPPTTCTVDLGWGTFAPVNENGDPASGVMSLSLKTESRPGVPWTTTTLPPPTATHRASDRLTEVINENVAGSMTNRAPASPDVA